MKKILAGLLIIGVFAVAAFSLWLLACGHGYFADLCRVSSVFCGTGPCPADASAFQTASFHLNVFRGLSTAVLLLGLLGAVLIVASWAAEIVTAQKFNLISTVSVTSQPSQRRLVHWLTLLEKRDPA